MLKKVRRKKMPIPQRRWWKKRQALLAVILALSLVGVILAQWRSKRISHSLSFNPQTSQTPQLTKEYIYAGGRLIATEEPSTGGGASPLSPPASLIAMGTSTPQVTLTWTASTGGTVAHYQVERCQSIAPNCYSVVAANVPANVPTINYTDTTVSPGTAYLYRVRAVDTSINFSNYSSVELATTVSFANDPLQAGIIVKAQHITELRQAINAVRALANLSAATWTNTVQAGAQIRAVDFQELRTNLDQARSALSLAAASYTNQPLSAGTTLIKKDHIEELRQGVK